MGLMKKLTSALVASSLVLTMVGSAFAAYTPAAGETAGTRMQKLGIIQGRGDGSDLALNSEITRAELVTVIVRAFGKEEDAKLLKGSTIFPDIQNHWASGNIAMAVALVEKAGSDPIGMPDGKFAPDAKLTPAQAVAFLMKFLGAKADPNKAWPANYLDVAVEKGLITTEDKALIAPMLNDNATRGLVFYMFDRAFASYDLGAGETFYTKYVDPTDPELVVTEPAATTMDSSITISGKATGATEVKVGSALVTLAADGSFSYVYELPELGDYPITVVAKDLAGNSAEESFTVTRTFGTANKIEAPASITVGAGASVDLAVVVKDANGNVVENADVTLAETELGTYADGKFMAGDKVGQGTITLTSGELTATVDVTVTAGELASLEVTTDPATTNVSVGTPLKLVTVGKDTKGNTVDVTGKVTYTATNGIVDAAGNFAATVSGTSKITATVGSISKELNVTVFSTAAKLAVNNTKAIVANGTSKDTVTVTVQDANGFAVNNYSGKVTLTVVGGSSELGIVNGNSTAATLQADAVNGVATFTVKSLQAGGNLTARVQATAGTLTGALKEISLVKPTLAKFEATVDVNQIAAHITAGAKVTVKGYDQEGVNVPAGDSYTITLTSDNTNVIKFSGVTGASTDVAFASTDASKTVDLVATAIPGVANLTAVVKNSSGTVITTVPVNTLTVTTQYATAPAKVQLIGADSITLTGTSATAKAFKVAYLDQLGNVLSHMAAPTISFEIKDANGNDASAKFTVGNGTTAYQNGIFNKTIAPVTTAANAGTYTITVKATDLTSTSGTVVVNPGPATAVGNTVTLAADNIEIAGDGISKVVLTATVKDSAGNVVPFNGDVTLVRSNGTNLSMPSSTTVAAVNGVATFTLQAGYTFGTDVFNVTLDLDGSGTVAASEKSADQNVTTVLTGAATKLVVGTTTNTGKKAGETYTVKVYVHDAQGTSKVVTSDNGRPVSLVITDGTGTVNEAAATTVNGIATFTVTSTKANTVTFHAEAMGLTKSANATAAFTAASPSKIVLKADTANLQVGSDTVITASYVDQFGNAATGTPNLKNIKVEGSVGTAVATEGSTTAITATAAGTFILNAASFPASGTISAEDNGSTPVTVEPIAITVYNAGLANKVQLQAVENVTAAADTPAFTVKATIVDYTGMALTKHEGASTAVPFKVLVKAPGAADYSTTPLTATSYKDGVATFTFENDADNNAGTYTFKVVDYTSTELAAAPFDTLSAEDRALFAAMGSTSVSADILPGTAAAVDTVVIDVGTGNDVITPALTSDVTFVKVKVVDAKKNVVTTFNGQGKLTLTSASGLTLVGADTNGVLSLNITNGYGVAQIQRTNSTTYSGTFTGSVILSGTTYTADGSALSIHN